MADAEGSHQYPRVLTEVSGEDGRLVLVRIFPLRVGRRRHELVSPGANIPNASYDLLMKSTSGNLLIRTPHDVMRLCQTHAGTERGLSATPTPTTTTATFISLMTRRPPGSEGGGHPPAQGRPTLTLRWSKFNLKTTELKRKYEILFEQTAPASGGGAEWGGGLIEYTSDLTAKVFSSAYLINA